MILDAAATVASTLLVVLVRKKTRELSELAEVALQIISLERGMPVLVDVYPRKDLKNIG